MQQDFELPPALAGGLRIDNVYWALAKLRGFRLKPIYILIPITPAKAGANSKH